MAFLAAMIFLSPAGHAQEKRTPGEHLDDAALVAKAKTALIAAEGVPGGRINVEAFKGTVVLAGFMENQEQRIAAVRAVKDMDGVDKVVDAMVIHPGKRSIGRHLDDQTIHTKVDLRIRKEEGFVKVTVQVRDGEVLLGGFAENAEVRAAAEKIAGTVEGVEKIYNKITLQS